MTRLPSMDLYNEAVQNPGKAFADPELARGEVVKNGLGLPKPASGGFALTYGVKSGPKTYAVRLFHRHSPGLEKRYQQISAELARTASPYFVEFEFQPSGIVVQGGRFPVVKMAWASGEVLGGWVKRNRSSKTSMLALRDQFRQLSAHLESRGIAHGDIQGGNVMVDSGAKIRLIDYDGMWVPTMPRGNGEELGHIHFQHPKRDRGSFGPSIDRFSFLVLELTLAALAEDPRLFDEFNTGENLVLQQTDYLDPRRSKALQRLRQILALRNLIDNFERVCLAQVDQVPTLSDFLSGSNIPVPTLVPAQPSAPSVLVYRGPNAVLDASDYAEAERLVGDRVELIGRVAAVKVDFDRNHQRYAFVNFGDWRQCAVKVQIWSNVLASFSRAPDQTWKGRWISVTGLVQAPFETKSGYDHIGIEIEDESEIRFVTEDEALFRLGKRNRMSAGSQPVSAPGSNQSLIEEIRRGGASRGHSVPAAPPSAGASSPSGSTSWTQIGTPTGSRSTNQNLLDQMRTSGSFGSSGSSKPIPASAGSPVAPSAPPGSQQPSPRAGGGGSGCWGCLIPLLAIGALFVLPQLCTSSKSRSPSRRVWQPPPRVSEEALASVIEQQRIRQEVDRKFVNHLSVDERLRKLDAGLRGSQSASPSDDVGGLQGPRR